MEWLDGEVRVTGGKASGARENAGAWHARLLQGFDSAPTDVITTVIFCKDKNAKEAGFSMGMAETLGLPGPEG
jgi:hypothetical protein